MKMCGKMVGILEEIDRLYGLVREDLELAKALEKLATPDVDAAVNILASMLATWLGNLPGFIDELRNLVKGVTKEGC